MPKSLFIATIGQTTSLLLKPLNFDDQLQLAAVKRVTPSIMKPANRPLRSRGQIQEALKPILYADIFDYPLTFEEIYKFLEFKTTPNVLKSLLEQATRDKHIVLVDGFYSLVDRPHLAAKRRERGLAAQALWPKARFYGRWIASLPFVRMVAVTGSLAVENPCDGVDDIDYLIVTRPGRLWLCRAMVILMVHYGHRQGVHLCPNYMLTENLLFFEDDNLFIAREMLQMVPLYGKSTYLDMRQVNAWITDYLPQGAGLNLTHVDDGLSPPQCFFKKSGEFILSSFLGDLLEKPLQRYQITKHTRLAEKNGAADKVIFTADQCKGHYDGHKNNTMKAYQSRLEKYKQTAASST